MKNRSEDEVLAAMLRRFLADEDTYWGVAGVERPFLVLDGGFTITKEELSVIEAVQSS